MISSDTKQPPAIDPLCILPIPTPVVSLCFVSKHKNHDYLAKEKSSSVNDSDDDGDTSSDDDDDEIPLFRSSIQQRQQQQSTKNQFSTLRLLSERFIISCHRTGGEALIWDLNQRKVVSQLERSYDGDDVSGLGIKRTDMPHRVMLQTRDSNGTVSIHTLHGDNSCSIVRKFETYSQTFCLAAPCKGDPNLFALPSRQDSVVTVVDERDPTPVATFMNPNHGMLTSLAMCVVGNHGRPVVAAGMESGSIFFHDFSYSNSAGNKNKNNINSFATKAGEINLGKDPVLSLDIVPSEAGNSSQPNNSGNSSSVIAVAGLAGDAVELSKLPSKDQGTVSLIKATTTFGGSSNNNDKDSNTAAATTTTTTTGNSKSNWNIRLRSRMSTCNINDDRFYGKPGVSICRFRPGDGRLVAIGGWDYRLRIFERSKGNLMAILRGHSGSVSALDWAPDASSSGLLASSGGDDSQIYIWSCYGN